MEQYIAGLVPKYAAETAGQKAKDIQFSAIKDDLMNALAPNLPGVGELNAEKLKAGLDKWLPLIEGILPADGFINGLAYPTLADFAVLLMHDGFMPYDAAFKCCALVDGAKTEYLASYPKFAGLVSRTKADPDVAAYLKEQAPVSYMYGNPFGI